MANIDLPELNLLQEIINALKSKSLYILGAGASKKYIEIKYNLYDLAVEAIDKFMLLPITKPTYILSSEEIARLEIQGSKHILHRTIDGRLLIDNRDMDFYDIIIHYYPALLEFMCALTYSLDKPPQCCPEYQIFNLANKNSYLVTLNHDNLAKYFINKIEVTPLHGIITPGHKKIIRDFVPHIFDMDVKNDILKGLYLATRESERLLLEKREYKRLMETLKSNKFKYIVIIGYSFFKKNDYDINDVVTYGLIRDYLCENKCNLIIVDPKDEYFVADIFAKTLSVLGKVKCFSIYWDSFTSAFFLTKQLKNSPFWKFDLLDQRRFIEFYRYFKDNDWGCYKNGQLRKYLSGKSYN